MSMARDAFDAVAWLDPPLLVSRRLAGTSYDVRIAGKATILTLPATGPSKLTMSEGHPPRETPEFPPPKLAEPIVSGVHIQITSSTRIPKAPLIVDAIRLRWKDRTRTQQIRKSNHYGDREFDVDLGAWLSLAREWLAAWRGGVRRPATLEPTPIIRMASSAYGGSIGDGGNSPPGVYLGGGRIILTPAELRGAFAAASIGEPLPLEHQLLNEAVAYAAARHRRHAVISACSAAEVALSKSVRRLLDTAGRTEKEVAEVLKPVRGVSELYRLNAARKGNLPVSLGEVIDRLCGPRNLAAHAGREPSDETVRGAIQTARALLMLSPLPTPRSFRLPD
jgi:hypothetical protein